MTRGYITMIFEVITEILRYYMVKTPSELIYLTIPFIVFFLAPAVLIHRETLRKTPAKKVALIMLGLLFLFCCSIIANFDEIRTFYFMRNLGWHINSFQSSREIVFLDMDNEDTTQYISKSGEMDLMFFDINQIENISAMMCSEKIGLNVNDYIGKKIKLYIWNSSDATLIKQEGLFYTDQVSVLVGVYNHKVVFAALHTCSPPIEPVTISIFHYFPIDYTPERIVQELTSYYEKQDIFDLPIMDDV